MLTRMDEIIDRLSGLDCGSCGCPSCRSLPEEMLELEGLNPPVSNRS